MKRGTSGETGAATTTRIGFVQTEPRFGSPESNLERAGELIHGAPPFDVLVLPELFATGYVFLDRAELSGLAEGEHGPTGNFLRRAAEARGAWLVGGFVERDGDRLFNSAAIAGPRGEWSVYRKIHLFDREKELFDAGDRPFSAETIATERGGVRVGLMICFDWFFPESARSLVLDGAEVLLHPSNLVLPHCQAAMPTRCLENRVYAVTANRFGGDDRGEHRLSFTGCSQITAPDGQVLASAPAAGEAVEVVEVDLTRARKKRVTERNDLLADRRPEMYRNPG